MKHQTARVVLVAAAVVIASVLTAGAQSLADVARKEAARRKDVKAPVTVITNDNLKVVPPVAPPAVPAEAGVQPPSPDAAAPADAAQEKAQEKAEETPNPTRDPEYWRKRMADARLARDRNAFMLEAVQSRINALTNDFYARDDPYQREQIGLARQKALAEFERMTQHQADLEKAIADIEEEARRANVPAGWLR